MSANKSPQTQLTAVTAITDLILDYPALSAAFNHLGAGDKLRKVLPDGERCVNGTRRLLHTATRRALASVDEVEVLSLVCRLSVILSLWGDTRVITKQLLRYVGWVNM